jgi:hypothetical protein
MASRPGLRQQGRVGTGPRWKRWHDGAGRMRCDMDAHLAEDETSGRLTVVLTYVLGVAVGTILAVAL